jgi:hypothetical protein
MKKNFIAFVIALLSTVLDFTLTGAIISSSDVTIRFWLMFLLSIIKTVFAYNFYYTIKHYQDLMKG